MLASVRFAGDPILEACLDGTHTMAEHESGPAVGKVQRALSEIGYEFPTYGVDSNFGQETKNAVTAFKQAQGITPSDPVVGAQTMAALDSIFAELVVPLPPQEIEIGGALEPAVVSRSPTGVAKIPRAKTIVDAFRANTAGSSWQKLDRAKVADSIEATLTWPDNLEQGGEGLCTEASFVHIWVQEAPDAYAEFATTLFDRAAATIAPTQSFGGVRIKPSPDLLGSDYPRIAQRMHELRFRVPPQADWMVLSAIRDSSNLSLDFTGDPDDWVSHNIGDGGFDDELEKWLSATQLFSAVTNETTGLFTKPASHALRLDPANTRVAMALDARMLGANKGRHFGVLRSRVIDVGDAYALWLWTWGQVRYVRCRKDEFESTYYGALFSNPRP